MRRWSEIFVDALESFEGGKRWTKGQLFRTKDGRPLCGVSRTAEEYKKVAEEADSFCAYGAIFKSMVTHGDLTQWVIDHELTGYTTSPIERLLTGGQGAVTGINDRAQSFDTVKEMFCTGIKKALAEEAAADAKEEAHVD